MNAISSFILLALSLALQVCMADDAFFFEKDSKKQTLAVNDKTMIVTMPFNRVLPPKVKRIDAYHFGLNDLEYAIEVHLSKRPKGSWNPKLRLGDDLFMGRDILVRKRDYNVTNRNELSNPKPNFYTFTIFSNCLLYTSPSPRDKRQSRMPSSA